jgi:hypothetical protein
VTLPVKVTPDGLFTVRLFRFTTLDGIKTPADVPPNTRLDEDDVVRFEGVPAMVGPFNVRIYAPTVKVPEVRVSVPPTMTLPHNETALLMVRLFNVTADKLAEPAPPIIILEVAPPMIVPQFIWPLSVNVFAPIDKPAPAGLNVPLIVGELCRVTIFELVIERPFKATTLDGIKTPADVPPNTRLEDAVVVRFDGVPVIVGPFNVRVYAPTVKVPEVRVRVPPTVTLPHIDTALLMVRLFKVTAGKSAVPAPPMIILEVAPPTRVPQLIWPLSVSVFAPIDNPAPAGLNVPLIVGEFCRVTIFELVIERPFRVVTLDGIKTPADVPPNTRLDEDDVVRFEGVPAIVGPFNVRIFPPTVNAPDVNVIVPETVVLPVSVTPALLFIVRLLALVSPLPVT